MKEIMIFVVFGKELWTKMFTKLTNTGKTKLTNTGAIQWKQHYWIPTLSLYRDCCLAIALVLLKLDRWKPFPSLPKHLLYFLLVSVFVSSSSSVFCLPCLPKSVFHYQVEDASKGISSFLPVDCMGWKTRKDCFFYVTAAPSVLIYGLSLSTSAFHPISIIVIFPQYRFNTLISLSYFSQEC